MPEQEITQRVFVHRGQPRVRNVYPNWAALLGVGVMFVGCYAVAAAKWMPDVSNRPVLALVGINFILIGLVVVVRIFKGMRLRARAREARGQQPWRYDYSWNIHGTDDGSGSSMVKDVMAVGSIGFFLVPFHILVYDDPPGDGGFILYGVLGLFDLIIFISLSYVVYKLLRMLIFGRPRVIFQQFPCLTGQSMNLIFSGGKRLANCKDLRAELHCIKEYYEWIDSGEDQSATHVNESIYRDSFHFSTDAAGMAQLSFPLPKDAVSTDLISDPNANPPKSPHYWELVITFRRPGIDYEGIFLVPVYRPA
ncbi:MAG: hypothetical protein C4581_04900 [Nitrospiraceae bacterium]|nr:MAG: hypothetical protein C4581_04900 [Nitrospiraceae bacterium]